MQGDPLSGDIFIFLSRRRNQIKLLRWERDGFALYSKRLEEGTYELPVQAGEGSFLITHQELLLIRQGICLEQVRYRKRYARQIGERLTLKVNCYILRMTYVGTPVLPRIEIYD